jgi:hypothetical protein
MRVRAWLWVAVGLTIASSAEAKKFRYAEGPKPPGDTTYSAAEVVLEPVVRSRGPRVAPTNLQVISLVANTAIQQALRSVPLDSGSHVTLAPAEGHPLNFLIEHSVLRELSRRRISATVRRSVVPDDSLALLAMGERDPLLEYQLASARITYLRLIGGYVLPSRAKVERQGLVEGGLVLRDPATSRVLWTQDASANLVDAVPRGQLRLVEDERFSDLKSVVPERNLGRYTEPLILGAVVTGLIVLFFQNRP